MKTCTITECSRPRRTRTADYCEMHYYRIRRSGQPGAPESQRRTPGTCQHDGCERPDAGAHRWCRLHAERVRKHGDPACVLSAPRNSGEQHPQWKGGSVLYSGMHMRIRKVRGAASTRECVDCGDTASHWSYDHRDPDERHSPEGAYSLDIEHYQPRCVPCHKTYDLAVA